MIPLSANSFVLVWFHFILTFPRVSFSADNRQIVSASRDRSIKLWNTLGECKFNITEDGHSEWVSCVRFSPNPANPVIVSAGWDKVVKVSSTCSVQTALGDMMLSSYICYFRGLAPYETIFPPRSLIPNTNYPFLDSS